MRDALPFIDALLERRPAGFRNKHFAELLGFSRPRASQVLKRLVLSGELERLGEGRGPYVRGPHYGAKSGFAQGALRRSFWSLLVAEYPSIGYLALHRLGLSQVRTRWQVQEALRGLLDVSLRFLIVDFEGVHALSDAAASELLFRVRREYSIRVEPINLEAPVARTVWRPMDVCVPSRLDGPAGHA